jgi:3-hydroxybutyryl-CoA dehydrogenase
MKKQFKTNEIPIGVVGLGLMGCSITTCLLMAGHPVVAVAPLPIDLDNAEKRIRHHLQKSLEEGLIQHPPDAYFKHLIITENYAGLAHCAIVMECTIENIDIKRAVYRKIEKIIAPQAILTSNTSAIPISILQAEVQFPTRFGGHLWRQKRHRKGRISLRNIAFVAKRTDFGAQRNQRFYYQSLDVCDVSGGVFFGRKWVCLGGRCG